MASTGRLISWLAPKTGAAPAAASSKLLVSSSRRTLMTTATRAVVTRSSTTTPNRRPQGNHNQWWVKSSDSIIPVPSRSRWYSTESKNKMWTFDEISALVSSSPKQQQNTLLIDVREPGELVSTGRIPGSVNIPVSSQPDALHLNPEDFEDRFGFSKPDSSPENGPELVFYCKAGVRSRAAAGLARDAGFTRVSEYPGSWVDWAGKGGKVERS